jgi:SWI/SNF-related matrix-associated actin-dependent regulator of chromatin subfamily B protein 1
MIEPDVFAEALCEDFHVPNHLYDMIVPMVSKSIKEQLDDLLQHTPWENFKTQTSQGNLDQELEENPDLRVLIKLDIIIGNQALQDQFEWDLNCQKNSPERFAQILVQDLRLSYDFV